MGPVPLFLSSESIIEITSTGSADTKMKFWLTLFERYSEKGLVPEVCFGNSFSAIDEKYALKNMH